MKNIFSQFVIKSILVIVLFSVNIIHSQCSLGCNPNAGIYTTSDPATIAYDNMGSSFHTTFIQESNNTFKVWGEEVLNDGVNHALTPVIINSTTYPALTGTVYKAGLGSSSQQNVQLIVLTSTGLFAVGSETCVLDGTITSSNTFQKLTINGQTDGLPEGIDPLDVKMMFVSYRTIIITTCDGRVFVLSKNPNVRGNGGIGTSTSWSQVMVNATTPLTNVIVARGQSGTAFALKSDGTIWTWGSNTFLGNNSLPIARTFATQMILPAGLTGVKMIQCANSGTSYLPSYYILGVDSKVYSLGTNSNGQLGDNSTTQRTTWVNCLKPDNSIINDALWISTNEHDVLYPSVSIIRQGGLLYTGGSSSGGMIGRGTGATNFLDIPSGVLQTDVITFVEVGGHTTALIKQGTANYGYVGHFVNGSTGGGVSSSSNITTFDFVLPPVVNVCGSTCLPPTATTNSPCPGQTAIVNVQSVNGAVITYNVNGGASQTVTIGTNSTGIITIPNVQTNTTINFTLLSNSLNNCNLVLTNSVTVPVNNNTIAPTVTVSSNNCTSTGTALVTNYDNGNVYTSIPPGLTVNASGQISGFTCGVSYILAATFDLSCTVNSPSFTVPCPSVVPATPIVTTTPSSCVAIGTASVTNYDTTLTYTSTPAGLSVGTGGVISGFTCGTPYTITASNAANCQAVSTSFIVQCQFPNPIVPIVTTTLATCSANGSAIVTNYDATLTYTSSPAGPTVGAGGIITGFTCGTSYTITVANTATCQATSTSFTIQCQLVSPINPLVSTTLATCFVNGTATINNYDAILTYTSTPSGLIVGTGGVISGFTCGTSYIITASNAANCQAVSTSFIVQCQFPNPVVPIVTTTLATCSANGSATVTNYDATLTYTSSPAGLTVGAGGIITGFTCGTSYTITVANTATCQATSTNFIVPCQFVTPAIPSIIISPATCTANGAATINNYDATLTYTSTPAGLILGTGGVISGFTCGTSYTITASNVANCQAISTSFIVPCQFAIPDNPTINIAPATCFANGTATVSNYISTNIYSSTPAGLSVGTGGVISGLTCGTSYTITTTITASCQSTSVSFVVPCQLTVVTPTVTVSPATCSANGSAIVANYLASNTYSSIPVGLTVGTSGIISGYICGNSYTIVATNPLTCQALSTSFVVPCQLVTPPAPITIIPLPYCLNQTSLPLEATGSNLLWYTTATGGTGTTTAPTPLTTAPGTTNYYVTQTINGCESPRTLIPVVVLPEPSFTTNALNNEFSMCTGSTSNIIFTGNHPNIKYSWSYSVIGGNNSDVIGAVSGNGALNFTNTIITLIPGITTPRIVTYTVTPFIGLCSGPPVTVKLTINPKPNVSVPVYNPICSGEKITITPTSDYPNTIFDWYVSLPQTFGVSGFSNGSGSLIEHTLVATGTSAGQVTYVITPRLGNCLGTPVTVTIQVKPLPTANINSNTTTICSGGMPNIIVSSVNTSTTFTYIAISFNVTGASGGVISSNFAQINNQTLIATGNQQGYVDYVFTPTLNECKGDVVTVRVLVNPRPIPTLTNGVICIDTSGNVYQNYVLNAGLDNTNHTFQWSFTPAGSTTTQPLLGNQNTQVASAVGTYTVIATNTTTGCISGSVQATVTSSLPATAITTQVTQMFSGAAMVTVSITGGTGSYLYQLNDENFQESPIFTNVPAGTHTVKVIDTQGCTYLTTTVLIINYMQFFTPNNDGYQDVWKIIGFNQPDAKIYIYDKYGKLLKQLSGSDSSDGWNGTLNGQPLPASDYWFTIDYVENNQNKVFKSHFSLKR